MSYPRLWTGTSGFSYKEWKGSFYPEKLPANKMLAYYSRQLGSVEINNTFYRLPRAELLEKWAAQVPDEFSFVLKASRRITHMKRLKDAGDPLEYLVRTSVGALGRRLGPILFQLPPYLRADVERLGDFLALLSDGVGAPEGFRAAFEFRHASWFTDEVYQALADHGAALVTADTGEGEAPVVDTASFGYARLRQPGLHRRRAARLGLRVAATRLERRLRLLQARGRGCGAADGGGVSRGLGDRSGGLHRAGLAPAASRVSVPAPPPADGRTPRRPAPAASPRPSGRTGAA